MPSAVASAAVTGAANARCIALPVKTVTAMAQANAELMNVRLVVLIVPLFIMPIGDLVVNRTLGQS